MVVSSVVGVGGSGAGMEVPLVRESDSEGERGPI